MENEQGRKWQLTLNNPADHQWDHDRINNCMDNLTYQYYCLADEIGENQTPHIHLFMQLTSPVRFDRLKKIFGEWHIERCKGSAMQNREYVFKEGKWTEDKKGETNLRETHEEYGELIEEKQGKRTDLEMLYSLIKEGATDFQIVDALPKYMMFLDKIDKARQMIIEDKFRKTWRKLHVEYIYGASGTGKTRSIMEKYGYENVHRITDYQHPWDTYKAQDVIIFEEFRSSLKIADMLNYLDGYPLTLPSRYNNKVACYTKVFIITNIPIFHQYSELQYTQETTFQAFMRRIQMVKHMDNEINEYMVNYDIKEKTIELVNIPF